MIANNNLLFFKKFQDTAYSFYGLEDDDDDDDDEIDDMIREIPSPTITISKEFTYKPRKVSFNQYLKDANEKQDANGSFKRPESVN